MMFYIIICTILIYVIYIIVQTYSKHRSYRKLFEEIKVNKLYPLIGNTHLYAGIKVEELLKILTKLWEEQGKRMFVNKIGNSITIVLCDPDNIEAILTDTKNITKMSDYKFLHRWLGNGLLFSTGNFWKQQRKILTPSFHFKILEKFVDVYNKNVKILIKKMSEEKDKVLDVHPLMQLYSLDVICESSMGTPIHAQENANSEYVKAVKRFMNVFLRRSFCPWKRFDWLYPFSSDYHWEMKALKTLLEIGDKVIKSRREQLKNQNGVLKFETKNENTEFEYGGGKKVTFLDMLLLSKTSEGESLSDKIIRDEVNTVVFAGHDTTGTALCFALYSLANNPEVQLLAFEEQMKVFENEKSKNPSFTDLQNMPYLERVIKETLRLYPSVPFYGRVLENDFILKDPVGSVVPAGTMLLMSSYFLMRNEKYYPDPLKFDPDRFLPENLQGKNPFLYIPFSGGLRNCIGQKFAMYEMKATLSCLLRNFEFVSAGSEYEAQVFSAVTLNSANGFNLICKDRIYPNVK